MNASPQERYCRGQMPCTLLRCLSPFVTRTEPVGPLDDDNDKVQDGVYETQVSLLVRDVIQDHANLFDGHRERLDSQPLLDAG